jgi:hypothetical protein
MEVTTPAYWMIVTSPDNFARTREHGFSVQGIKTRHRRKSDVMKAGDRVLYYLTRIQRFAGTATITGQSFEDHEVIWRSKPGEDYPWRFPIEPNVVLDPAVGVTAESLVSELEFVKKWPPEYWRLAFQGNVHVLPAADFETIESALRAVAHRAA